MTDDEPRPIDEPLDPDVVAMIRALYAPPGDAGYWPALEARIRARVSSAPQARWWDIVGGWAHAGLVAAAAALVAGLVGALLLRAHATEMRTAYEKAIHAAPAESVAVPSGALSERPGPDQRGATFRDVISQ